MKPFDREPNILQYRQRHQYTLLNPSESSCGYRLYVMDGEVWLAKLEYNEKLNGSNNEYIWSIYKIDKYGGELPAGAAATPAAYPEDTADTTLPPGGIILDARINGGNIQGIAINNEDQLKVIYEAINIHKLSSDESAAAEIMPADNYITLHVPSGEPENTLYDDYYVYDRDGMHCIQKGLYGMYSYLSDEAYNVISDIAKGYYHATNHFAYQPAGSAESGSDDIEIGLYIGGEGIHDIPVKETSQLQIIDDMVSAYLIRSAAWEGADISTLDSYITVNGIKADALQGSYLCIFEKGGKYYMQNGKKGRQTALDGETYNALLEIALGYNLPDAMTVVSGKNSVKALENTIWTESCNQHWDSTWLKPEQVAKYLQYLDIEQSDGLSPFTPYLNGEKARGTYKLYDSDYNEIPIAMPSGLEPQTHIFANAQRPGRYIVELRASTDWGGIKFGNQYFFGVILPEK
ncbi:MAG: hypothetical protein ACM3S4_05005 [Burkholderiales bacterium]